MSEITTHLQPAPFPLDLPVGTGDVPVPRGEPRLRLWPGVLVVAIQWLIILGPPLLAPDQPFLGFMALMLGNAFGVLGILIWWLGVSRLRWQDRVLIPLACEAIGANAALLFHPNNTFMLMLCYGFARITTAWVVWLALTPFLNWPVRRLGLLLVFVVTWGYFDMVRFDGVSGGFNTELSWRWVPTAEDKFQAEKKDKPTEPLPTLGADTPPVKLQAGDWPGFRGPNRDGRLTSVRFNSDWKQHPPKQLWRHRVGPGWSSFAVAGNRLYTQEQDGDDEKVLCYDTETGKEVWVHRDHTRFTEPVAGPGPRATPTIHDGKIYAMGGSGKLNCLDAATGAPQWSRDILADSGAKLPNWGFAASPLVADGVVTVFAGGDNKSVLGYKAKSGELAWAAGTGKLSYCSPHLARLDGVDQVLLATDAGLTAYQPTRGDVLWHHDWPINGQPRVVQPAILDGGDILIGTGFSGGTRCVHVSGGKSGWSDTELWTTKAIKPYFNDLVVHKGHMYGFDNNFFTCVDLQEGKGSWRVRGYDSGQVLLLADQDLLLILSEKGAVALVKANPEKHEELPGRFQALHGKTWNHPVIAHGKLFVRNGEEMACYQLKKE